MKNLISIAVVLALASGLILGSIGTLVPVVAQESNMTGGNMTGGNMTTGGGAGDTGGLTGGGAAGGGGGS